MSSPKSFTVKLTILPVPIRIWDLSIGELFVIQEQGYNSTTERYEVFQKFSNTKCRLISLPDKPEFSIPLLFGSIEGCIGYKVTEEYFCNFD